MAPHSGGQVHLQLCLWAAQLGLDAAKRGSAGSQPRRSLASADFNGLGERAQVCGHCTDAQVPEERVTLVAKAGL